MLKKKQKRRSLDPLQYKLSTSVKNIEQDVQLGDSDVHSFDKKQKKKKSASVGIQINESIIPIQTDQEIQTTEIKVEGSSQTPWRAKKNKITQYETQILTKEEQITIIKSHKFKQFLNKVTPRVTKVLKMNETIDCFKNEFACFMSMDAEPMGNKSEEIEEIQNLTDVELTKNKSVSNLEWMPNDNKTIGISVAINGTFDNRIDLSSKTTTTYILLFRLEQVKSKATIVLVVPDEILCFKFNPNNPQIVVGGLMSGQVVYWDFQHLNLEEIFSESQSKRRNKNKDVLNEENDETEKRYMIQPKNMSTTEVSHKHPVTDIHWISMEQQIGKADIPDRRRKKYSEQFITFCGDENAYLWDIAPPVKSKKKIKVDRNPKTKIYLLLY
eukprot:UN32408